MHDPSKTNQEMLDEISALKQKIKELEQAQSEHYRAIYDQSPIAIELYDATGALINVNPECLRLFGIENMKVPAGFSLFTDPNIDDENKEKLYKGENIHYQVHFDFEKVKILNLYPTSKEGIIWLDVLITPMRNRSDSITGFLVQIQDITDRYRAEEALRESEERFRTIIDKTPLGMSLIDIDGRYEYVNPAFVKIFGYDLSDIPTGKEWFRTVYPDPEYRREVIANWKDDLSSYPNLEIRPRIHKVRCKDGAIKTILFRPVTLYSGKQLIIYEDITEREMMQELLQESEVKLKAIFNTVGTGILIIDRDNQVIIEANKTAIEMTGLPKERIIGQSCYSLVCPAQAGKCPVKDFSQSIYHSENELFCTDGHLKNILKTVYPITIKGKNCFIESFIDISDRKRAEKELKESEEKFRLSFMTGLDAYMWTTLEEGRIIEINPVFEDVFGFTRDEAIGKTTPQLNLWYDPHARAKFVSKLEAEGFIRDLELDARKKDEKIITISISANKIFVNKQWFVLSVIRDITDRKRMLDELENHHHHLEKMVAIRTAELAEVAESLRIAKEKAEKASQAKDDLLSNVSHELRTPMTTIREGVSQVLDGILGPTTEDQREFLGIVQVDAERLSRIIDDLLDVSRIEAGRLEIHKEYEDMIRIAKQVTNIFKPQADAKNLRIKTDFPESIIEAHVDPDKIFQVWANLVNNALKFTLQGHIELSIKERENRVICTVKDTGVGISTEDIPKIFDKFYQGTIKKGQKEKGAGLGLTIAKAIIESHEGTLSVESVPGQGSLFIFEIPKEPL